MVMLGNTIRLMKNINKRTLLTRGMAVPLVVIIVSVIIILIFSISKTGNDYYRFAVSEVKALKIEQFISAFLNETSSHLNYEINQPEGDKLTEIRDAFLNLDSGSAGKDVSSMIFTSSFRDLYSDSLKDIANSLKIDFNSFVQNNITATIAKFDSLKVPKRMNLDSKEKKLVLKVSARVSYMGIERENGIRFMMKIVRINLPVLSKFTLFVKNSYQETYNNNSNFKGLGYNVALGVDGKLKSLKSKKYIAPLILNNGGKSTPVKDRGKIFLGGSTSASQKIIVKLVEESSKFDSDDGKCPYSNIIECGSSKSLARERRGIKKTVPQGDVSFFYFGFGSHLTYTILTLFKLDDIFKTNKFGKLVAESGIKDLSLNPNTFAQCAPLLLFGDNLTSRPTMVYGNVWRSFVRICEHHIHGSSGLLYYLAKGDDPNRPHNNNFPKTDPRDFYIDPDTITGTHGGFLFNNLTSKKYEDYMSTVVTEPYSSDKKINSSQDFKDPDVVDTGSSRFDLQYYNYSDFHKKHGKTGEKNEWKKGLESRICMEFETENEFKMCCIHGKKILISNGIIRINGDLDLTKKNVSVLTNCMKAIVIVNGDIKLPSIKRKSPGATLTFIANPVYNSSGSYKRGGNIQIVGNYLDASLVSWNEKENVMSFDTTPCKIKGSLALWKLNIKNFMNKKSVNLTYDPNLRQRKYFFSFLPQTDGVW